MSIQKGKAVLTHEYHFHRWNSPTQLEIFIQSWGCPQIIQVMDDHLRLETHGDSGAPPWHRKPPTKVTGGTGALGLVFAEWMASLGARPLGPVLVFGGTSRWGWTFPARFLLRLDAFDSFLKCVKSKMTKNFDWRGGNMR